MTASGGMAFAVEEVRYRHALLETRLPFRYGMVSMERAPHVLVEVQVAAGGRRWLGFAAETLVPKWFVKQPGTSHEEDVRDMGEVLRHAAPAKPTEQKIEAAAQIDKAPHPGTDNAIVVTVRCDRVGQHQLHMRLKISLCCRAALCSQGGEWVAGGDHGLHAYAQQGVGGDVFRHGWQQQADCNCGIVTAQTP